MQSTYNINLHFNQAVAQKTGYVFKAGDKGISFALNVVDLDPTGMTPKIVFHRSDGTSVESDTVTNVGRVYSYTTLGNEFAIPGVLVADLKFYDGNTQRVSTSSFIMGVISDTLDGLGGGTGGYSDELEQLREQMEQAAEDLDDMSDEFSNTLQDYIDAFGNTAPINPCGAYAAATEYHPRDAVTYTVSSKELTYINRRTCTGIAPDDPDDGATYWQVLIDVSGSGAFSALSDVAVDTQTLADKQATLYNSTTQKWENKTIFENSLTSTATDKALTAKMGKTLEDEVNAIVNVYGAKNLLENKLNNSSGVTVLDDGRIVLNGTVPAAFYLINQFTLKAGTYILSGSATLIQDFTMLLDKTDNTRIVTTNTSAQFTLTEDTVVNCYFYTDGAHTYTNDTFYPMIRDARIVDPTYEPYVPTNRELMSYKVNGIVGSKNQIPYPYYDTTKIENGITFTDNGDGTINIGTGTASNDVHFLIRSALERFCPQSGTYIISKGNIDDKVNLWVNAYNGSTLVRTLAWLTTETSVQITIDYSDYDRIDMGLVIDNGIVITTPITVKPMLRIASDTDETYQPFAMTNRQLTERTIVERRTINIEDAVNKNYNLGMGSDYIVYGFMPDANTVVGDIFVMYSGTASRWYLHLDSSQSAPLTMTGILLYGKL